MKKFLKREVYGTVGDFLKTAFCDFTLGFFAAGSIFTTADPSSELYRGASVAAWIMVAISLMLIVTQKR